MATTIVGSELAAGTERRGACSEALEWLRERPRTLSRLAREHPQWAAWLLTNGDVPPGVDAELLDSIVNLLSPEQLASLLIAVPDIPARYATRLRGAHLARVMRHRQDTSPSLLHMLTPDEMVRTLIVRQDISVNMFAGRLDGWQLARVLSHRVDEVVYKYLDRLTGRQVAMINRARAAIARAVEGRDTVTQTEKLANLLRGGKIVTPLDALRCAGSFRLAARIHDLRRAGMRIERVWVDIGGGRRVAGYVLEEDNNV